jgi:hypothetical protein
MIRPWMVDILGRRFTMRSDETREFLAALQISDELHKVRSEYAR